MERVAASATGQRPVMEVFTLADRPKKRVWLRGSGMAVRGLPWVVRERAPMARSLDEQLKVLDKRRYAERRPLLTRRDWEAPKTEAGQ